MTREIKYKIWDIKNLKFIDYNSHKIGAMLFDGWIVISTGWDSEDNPIWDWSKVEIDRYLPAQFTGLKDKNGKDIYEGDIIITGNGTIAKIVFGEFPFRIESEEEGQDIQDKSIGFFFEHPKKEYHEPFGECAGGGGTQYEVIGNIYENPELLK